MWICPYTQWYIKFDITDDLSAPRTAARLMHEEAERLGFVERNHSELSGLAAHMQGEYGVYGCCIMAGLKYAPKINVCHTVPDQSGCDFKTSTSHQYNLLLRKDSKGQNPHGDRPIVHMSTNGPCGKHIFAQGWTYWKKALRVGWWANPKGKGRCLFVHINDLNPMDTCPFILK